MGRKGVILVVEAGADGPQRVSARATAVQSIANRPIVSHALDALCEAGVDETVVVVPETQQLEISGCLAATASLDTPVRYVVHEDGQGPSSVLEQVADAVGDASCIVHLADGLLVQPLSPLADSLEENESDLLLLVQPGTPRAEPLGSAARELLRVAEFDRAKTELGCAGVCLARGAALRRASAGGLNGSSQLDLHAVTEGLACVAGGADVQVVHGWRRYVGDATDLLELNRAMLDLLTTDFGAVELLDNRIEGRVAIHPTARISASAIVGPVIIGPRARVTDAYVGPYTSIGADAHIEGVEVERSIISRGASITHLGGRLVASVVGDNARIFRDFSLPRAMRLAVGDNVEMALS